MISSNPEVFSVLTSSSFVDDFSLKRKTQGNTYLFSPQITEEEVTGRVLGDVVDRVFDGSTAAVLLKLFDVKSLNDDELKELRRIINRKLKGS